eukprot:m.371300 g.371300  ORF g.371300 m.371300 type:complete len:58 (-) comp58120_c0_seq1:105-278(-)
MVLFFKDHVMYTHTVRYMYVAPCTLHWDWLGCGLLNVSHAHRWIKHQPSATLLALPS